jgi:hypothetical protein
VAPLTVADRVVALLEWGDLAEVDAAIDVAEGEAPHWQTALWRGTRALLEGRFYACERFVAQALQEAVGAGEERATVLATLLLVALRREQERPAEAEVLLRAQLERSPAAPPGASAMLALLTGDMGRDGQARQELTRLLPAGVGDVDDVAEVGAGPGRLAALWLLAELTAKLEADDAVGVLRSCLLPYARDFAVEAGGSAFYGSTSLALGRLAFVAGRWDDAETLLSEAVDAHAGVGAPVLLAHSQRELAAVLRARGEPGDWERAVQLLSAATSIYRRLGIDRLAFDTQEVLARSEDGFASSDVPHEAEILFRRDGDTWLVGLRSEGTPSRLRDARGLHDVARLVAATRTPIHVADLLTGATNGAGMMPARPSGRSWRGPEPVVDAQTGAEYDARLVELAAELVEAERAGDLIRAALARAERDLLRAAVSGEGASDPLDRACRAVGARIRIALDRIEEAQPAIGRHLRRSIRTGTFCSYVPPHRVRWTL